MTQLAELCRPFPQKLIQKNPSGGGSYVPHPFYTQRLLLVLGGYDFEEVEIIRGDVTAVPPNPNGESKRAKAGSPALTNVIVGVMMRLTIEVDGKVHRFTNVGDCEDPNNWDTDGKRLKDAVSDAKKRCCADAGVGLHLYMKHQADFVLRDQLLVRERLDDVADSHEPRVKAPRPVEDTSDPTLLDDGRPFTEDET